MASLRETISAGLEAALSIPHAYSRKEVVEAEKKQWLKIHLAGKYFLLPLVDIGEGGKPIAIAWFNPDPNVNPELSHAAARAMAKHFEKTKARIVVTPPSSKSGAFIAEAAKRAGNISVITLLGGDNKAEVENFSSEPAVEYLPVTRLASGKPKYLGIRKEMRRQIMRDTPNGFYMTIADDVCTTESTLHAMEQVLQVEHHQIAVIAREAAEGDPPHLTSNMRTSLFLPEIGGLKREMLWSISDRAAIPSARIVR